MVAGAPVRALRVTYVGELGWELHVPTDGTGDGLSMRSCRAGGRMASSMPAIVRSRSPAAGESLSRLVGADISPRPLAARGRHGLGGEAEEEHRLPRPRGLWSHRRRRSSPKLLACFTVDDPNPSCCSAARPSSATASRSVGSLRAATATRWAPISASAMCATRRTASPLKMSTSGSYELGDRLQALPRAKVSLQPLYDPKMERVKA